MSGSADEVLGNRYRLIAPVGTGGMAVVWRARDLVLDRDVAVKLLAGELASKAGNRERIRSEAQVVARLQHPNITAVHDYGEAGDVSAGRNGRRPYVVMELLEGELLSDRLRSGPMSWRRATQICAQVAAGLAAAHEKGIVHRDIKPSNVMLTSAGAKILDFGVAGLAGSYDPDDERDGTVFGTPAYLAPERLLGGGVVSATDVYTVGLLVYRCLTDRLPWHADTPTQMIANHVYEPPHPLPEIPGMPGDVAKLITRCLAKDPDVRPPAAEVARVLAGATGIHIVLPGQDASSTQEVHAPPAGEDLPPRRPELPARRPGGSQHRAAASRTARRTWVAVVATLVAAGATTGMIIWKPWAPKPGCNVDFYIHPVNTAGVDKGFEARVTVANIGNRTLDPWQLVFIFRGGQQIDHVEGVGAYEPGIGGQRINGQSPLPPGKAVTFGIWGHGGAGNPPLPPSGFTLNDTACDLRLEMRRPDSELPAITENVDAPAEKARPPAGQGGPPPGGDPNGGPGGPGGPGDPNNPFDPNNPNPNQSQRLPGQTPPAYVQTNPSVNQRARRRRHA
ncbi:protein kinase domain-containing protein [Dactylosporangium sp. CS-033363]|uniref:protein kinase domain-containing protein n=1 Tax=Dactylosporangium sp. CS-033363 TaxID=3239935 RepID=UPI003D89DB00